ncbi:MAG: OmpA family protein [Bacteroidales bacterium]|nr:OmpA family protein [Bacteroidales bacterium]
MKLQFVIPFILSICLFSTADAQMKFYDEAEEAYQAGQFYEAVEMYRDAYDKIPGSEIKDEITFKIAECYRKTSQPRKAELWYSKAIKRDYDNPLIYLYYADALKTNEKFDEAIENYKKYGELNSDDPRGEMGVKSCSLAKQWKENPSGYKVAKQRYLNSTERDFCPSYSKAEYDEIYFTTSREECTGEETHGGTGGYFTDIFYSQKNVSGRWSDPEPIPGDVNTEVEEGATSFTNNYNTMYFTRCEVDNQQSMGCNIFRTVKDNGEWENPEPLSLAADSLVVAHPSITDDGSTLYFVSNRPGGYGKMDIWKINRNDDGWSEPVNPGQKINTPGNEMFPFIHPDGTLYFSSDYHPGMGGLDIFKATMQNNGEYEIENMRYPINSTHDDFGIIFEEEKEKGYFSSSRDGDDKIFSFVLPPLKFSVEGMVKDKKSEEPIQNASVKLVGSDGMTMSSETNEDGEFKFMLRPETDYVFVASKEKYLTNKGNLSTKGLEESKVFESELLLSSIEEPIELPNIFYDYDDWTLRSESKEALNQLVETLTDNPRVVIELRAHTDYRGDHAYNIELSTKRAQSVVNYLIDHGIDPERLRAKGYAATQPKVVDQNIAEEYDFLEKGTELTEEFIKDLNTEEQREIANQINRRTEFKVIATDYEP